MVCPPSVTQPRRNNTSSHTGGPGSPDKVLPLAPHTQATAGWVGNGRLALCTSIQLGLGWAAAAQAVSAEASEQLERLHKYMLFFFEAYKRLSTS